MYEIFENLKLSIIQAIKLRSQHISVKKVRLSFLKYLFLRSFSLRLLVVSCKGWLKVNFIEYNVLIIHNGRYTFPADEHNIVSSEVERALRIIS